MCICHAASNVSQYYTLVDGIERGNHAPHPSRRKSADPNVDPVSLSSVSYNNTDITHKASSVCQALKQS